MPDLRLATFNTHYGVRPPSARGAPYDLAGALARLTDTDVMVIQEVWRADGVSGAVDEFAAGNGYEMTDVVQARATMRHFWPKIAPDGDGTVGIAVLSRLPMRLVDQPAVGPTWRDPAPERRVIHVELDVGGTSVQLVAVHLTSRLPYGPPIQLRRLARATQPLEGPAVITGDCNFWGPPASMLLPGWRRAVRGRTWPARRPHSQIDHVFVRGAVTPVHAEILPDVGSDHRPVRVTLRVG